MGLKHPIKQLQIIGAHYDCNGFKEIKVIICTIAIHQKD
jgi:hypothetical protein